MIETSLNVNDYPEIPEEESEFENMEFMDGYDQVIEKELLEGDDEDE